MNLKNIPFYDFIAVALIFILIYSGQSILANVLIGSYLIFTVYRNMPTLQATKGSRAYNAGNVDMAMEYFRRAVNHPFAKPYIKSSYGYTLLREGQLEEAEKYLVEAQESNMKDPRFRYNNTLNLSILAWKKGDLDRAITIVEEIKDSYKNSIMYEILGYLYIAEGDYEKALALNKEAHEFNEGDHVITDNLAQSYYFLGEYDKAEALYEGIVNYVRFPEAHYYYGMILWKKKDYLGAHEALSMATKLKMSFLSILSKEDLDAAFTAFQKDLADQGLSLEALQQAKEQEEAAKKALEEAQEEQVEEQKVSEYKVD